MSNPESIKSIAYWQKPEETIDRTALESFQKERLTDTLRRVYKNVPFLPYAL